MLMKVILYWSDAGQVKGRHRSGRRTRKSGETIPGRGDGVVAGHDGLQPFTLDVDPVAGPVHLRPVTARASSSAMTSVSSRSGTTMISVGVLGQPGGPTERRTAEPAPQR